MSIHMVDKGRMDRSKPVVNNHDMLVDYRGNVTVPAHNTASLNYITPGTPAIVDNQSALYSGVKRFVGSGTALAQCLAADTYNVVQIAHNLGYTPMVEAFINNVPVSGITGNVDVPLPAWESVSETTGSSNVINFHVWLSLAVDSTNVYFITINSTGLDKTVPVTYYLYQQGTGI